MSERLGITYELSCGRGESPERKARGIALEQTVELPAATLPPGIESAMVGRIETLEPAGGNRFRARISYAPETVGGELTQLLNVLFGNISLKRGIRITGIAWPAALLRRLGGPAYGTAGIRRLTGVRERALLGTALKPIGLDAAALARRCEAFATGGIDLIKDDHGLADQPSAPFADRLQRCQEAVTRANARVGGNALYLPNVTAPFAEFPRRLEAARAAGCRAVLVSPWLAGLDSLRWARDQFGLALMAHPALTGSAFGRRHGIAPELVLGDLFRAAGADASIYPNADGRFGLSRRRCEAINGHLRGPLGELHPAFPVPAGGMDVARAPGWVRRYGIDTILLIGGSLYARGDLVRGARELLDAVREQHA
ncbi:MAG TPA: RuBisCO large subunit C-terminal-like domain-containing protein [Gammaproteobacteria bacterium]|nr:RuBisCO large subunit C-terminal-like domain-containing protein [Gammaproteobacteria bacterium]